MEAVMPVPYMHSQDLSSGPWFEIQLSINRDVQNILELKVSLNSIN